MSNVSPKLVLAFADPLACQVMSQNQKPYFHFGDATTNRAQNTILRNACSPEKTWKTGSLRQDELRISCAPVSRTTRRSCCIQVLSLKARCTVSSQAVVQNSFSEIWPTFPRRGVFLYGLLSRNFRGAHFHVWVTLGYQLGY